jgi:hypothetical protein
MDKLSDADVDRLINGGAGADNISSAQQSANDWIAGFAKKSQEDRAKRAAEKQIAPPPDEKALIEALARKDQAEYDRVRANLAETLGMRVGTLDGKVEVVRNQAVRQDERSHPAVLPDAEVRAREQHHGGRAISLYRSRPADAPHRRSRYVREEQRGASGHPGFWPYEGRGPDHPQR